ncbi:MAG: DNA gyrase subunit A [Anaerolineae bacterium]|nr:DNA gyrase subunit A [Anaerolineae bacterium]
MDIGTIKPTEIRDEMQSAYLDYAMSVITARALPDVRDGLKPVQRRILYQMQEMGLRHNVPHRKSARIVGDVMGHFHPHGGEAIYDALVRLAQDFTMRYPLVDGQGNFGSIDGDPPAAMRYTEARLTELAEELLADIGMDTVDFRPNFDDSLKEPSVLPAKVPNLLINGANGIAVGMATLIPPHNLSEICDAINYIIDHWNDIDDIEPDDLMQFVKGPDFPTGGIILGTDGIQEAYATGRGRIVVRGKLHTEPISGGRTRIVVSEIPYQVNKTTLIERIAELVRDRKIEEIGDLRDESDRQGMSLLIELKRGVDATPVVNALLKLTTLQTAFSLNMLALVDGEPRVLSLKRALQLFVQHRQSVITRRTRYELERAKLRAHILEGLKIALDHLDEVIRIIRQSADADTARANLIKKFKFSEIQATAILDMQLRRLAALERKKILDELAEVKKRTAYLEDLLAHPKKILGVIKQESTDLKERFGDARRTFIAQTSETEFKAGAQIAGAEEGIALVTLSRDGVLRKAPTSQYRRTRSDAVNGVTEKSDDPTISMLTAGTTDNLILFTNRGRVLPTRLTQVPDVARNPGGISLANQLESGEKFIGVLAFNGETANTFVTLATAQGKIKRTTLEEFTNINAGGAKAINLAEGEELGWAHLTGESGEFLITTAQGQALRFSQDAVPVQGRSAAGVWAIKLAENDRVISLDVVQPDTWLVIASANGFVKRVALKEFPVKGRHTGGVGVLTPDAKTGELAVARLAALDEDVMLIAASGLNVRVRAENLAKGNRAAKAKSFVTLKEGDVIARMTSLVGQAESATEDRKPELKKPEPVPSGSNRHGSENGSEKSAAPKESGSKTAAVKKERKQKAASGATTAPKVKTARESGAPRTQTRSSAKRTASKPPKAETKKTKPTRHSEKKGRVEDQDEQMELPLASFKPLPKKAK